MGQGFAQRAAAAFRGLPASGAGSLRGDLSLNATWLEGWVSCAITSALGFMHTRQPVLRGSNLVGGVWRADVSGIS